jgi:hypothetical protein
VRRGLLSSTRSTRLSPNSFFGHTFTGFGVGARTHPLQTFIQRMRRNGGDAADAAMYMIRHHFNYNDLSAVERRFARNVFLFYTWYRKNIPLQLAELVRRPGFFSAWRTATTCAPARRDTDQPGLVADQPVAADMSGEMPAVGPHPRLLQGPPARPRA